MKKDNKSILSRFVEEAFEKFNGNAMPELVTPDFYAHPWASYGLPAGPEGIQQVICLLGNAFIHARVSIHDIVAEGNKVVARYEFEADHTGELMGIAPTGKRIRIPGILMVRMENGKIAEYWREEDMLGFMQQIDAISPLAVEQ